jgi:hypothetical protein
MAFSWAVMPRDEEQARIDSQDPATIERLRIAAITTGEGWKDEQDPVKQQEMIDSLNAAHKRYSLAGAAATRRREAELTVARVAARQTRSTQVRAASCATCFQTRSRNGSCGCG